MALALVALLVLPAGASARQAAGAALRGTVVDAATGDGVEGAEVALSGRGRAVTDGRGRFRFDRVDPGRYVLEVSRLGYRIRTDTLAVPEGQSLEVTLEVSMEAIPLPGLTVVTRSLLLEARGFYERRSQGFRGVFMDRPAIEDRDPLYVADLFRNIPGVEVVDGARLRMSQSVTLRGGGTGCEPALWLDGIRSGMRNYDFIRPDHLEGIEVYTGGGAPGKFNDLCGTIVIWTRLPIRRR
ncbi:MAG: hypothetical protein AMXMBFR53_22070 [Gemmatimonadota bacterium]